MSASSVSAPPHVIESITAVTSSSGAVLTRASASETAA